MVIEYPTPRSAERAAESLRGQVIDFDTREVLADRSAPPPGWSRPIVPICPKTAKEFADAPCDCGHTGQWWNRRWIDRDARTSGHEEMCPGCGDVERWQMHPVTGEMTLLAEIRANEPPLF